MILAQVGHQPGDIIDRMYVDELHWRAIEHLAVFRLLREKDPTQK